ncbi:hypothetical protein VTP01DRAFT_3167 [Rhizomucor pusillus]|uniref:uncharacterized protein n=1 Tax=Rhizomucor pusillus TaxID=4840 RepID=UPI003742E8DC
MDDITQYIGVKVKITLLNGQQITGVIAGLSKPTRTLTLRSAVIQHADGRTETDPFLTVNGSEITDLNIQDSSTATEKKPSPSSEKQNVPSQKAPFVDPAIINAIPATNGTPKDASITSSPHIVKPDEKGSPSPKEKSSPESTPETKPAIPKKILFGSGSAAKHRPIPVDTECFDYEDFTHNYGKNNRRREKPSNKIDSKIPGKSTGSNANETKSIKILKTNKPDEANVDSNATVTATETSINSKTATLRKQSQTSIKIPSNLIPPKARAHAKTNGASPPVETSPPTSTVEKKSLPPPKVPEPVHIEEIESSDGESTEQQEGVPIIRSVADGVRLPVVTPDAMRRVEKICTSETGPTEQMMIENAGHGASIMALKAIGGHRRIQPNNHNAAPLVVVLVGNNNVGTYALAAARHLANRSCQVFIMLAMRKDAETSDNFANQKKCAEFAGAQIVTSVESLPEQLTTPVDLIIDALMGSETSLQSLRGDYETRQQLWDSMDWANNNKAPVLSLDFPSGVNALEGHPFHVMHYIQPKWTLCFGAPKQGCISRNVTGELFLADLGIPSISWKKCGVKPSHIPWGAEFILALEYEES